MISTQTEKGFMVHKSDKYKNCGVSEDPKYSNVEPLEAYETNKGLYSVAIFDPPYSSQGGGHTGTNCDMRRSASNMEFNYKYGINFPYSPMLILSMISESIATAVELLKPGGFLLVKCKDYKGLPYSSEITRLAREGGLFSFWATYIFSTRDKVVRNSSEFSNMLVFRKVEATPTETKCATLPGASITAVANIDYQTLAIQAKKKESRVKEAYAELLVHYAEICATHKEFVEQIGKGYRFSKKELQEFLKINNMQTEEQFTRNKANGSVMRKMRLASSDAKKQKIIDWPTTTFASSNAKGQN